MSEIERKGDRSQSTIYRCTECSCSLETGEEWGHGCDWNRRATLSSATVAEREPVVAAWQFKHYDPISGHPVWKTTLYWNGHRATEYRPLYLDPPPLSELEAENARLKTRVAEALKALDGLLEPFEGDDCRYDHHGYCQSHFLQDGDECCVKIARRVREGGKVDG